MCNVDIVQVSADICKWSTISCVKKTPNSTAFSILSLVVIFNELCSILCPILRRPGPAQQFCVNSPWDSPTEGTWKYSRSSGWYGLRPSLESTCGLQRDSLGFAPCGKEASGTFFCQKAHSQVKKEFKCNTVSTQHSRKAVSLQMGLWIVKTIFAYMYFL